MVRTSSHLRSSPYDLLSAADYKAAFGPDIITAKSYGSATLETIDTEKDAPRAIYQAAKAVADKKVWEIAHKNPDVDFTISK